MKLGHFPLIIPCALGISLAAGACASPRTGSLGHVPSEPSGGTPRSSATWQSTVGANVPAFWVRPGYRVDLVADGLQNARFMQFNARGDLYLARPDRGDILKLRLKDGRYEVVGTLISDKPTVHGMEFVDGWLWFTQSRAVWKAHIDKNGDADQVIMVVDGLPRGGHWWRSILVDTDGFYTSIGDSGNINDLTDSDREKIWKYSLDGKSRTLFVGGIRNTEKLLFKPGTKEIYGCDQGSDWFGKQLGDKEGDQPITDQYPPDEFNHYVQGGFYGHPFVVGAGVPRYEYMNRPDIKQIAAKTIPPVWLFGPHWAADGWIFLHKPAMGVEFVGDAMVALHGSWNRSTKAGYRVERIAFDKVTGEPWGGQMMVGTLAEDGKTVLGRPVDVAEAPDGSLLFSDDLTNRIYRISKVK
jgi:glucose/arabinose dehydrogenase